MGALFFCETSAQPKEDMIRQICSLRVYYRLLLLSSVSVAGLGCAARVLKPTVFGGIYLSLLVAPVVCRSR